MSDPTPLFTPKERARLDRLRIHRRRTMVGERQGDWRSGRLGAGGLFADHRDYVPGDDLRYVDWNVFGRLGHLVVKRFEAEENLALLLAIDRSSSMRGAKFQTARRMAGALGYIALAHLEHVRLAWLPSLTRAPLTVHRGGSGAAARLLDQLASTEVGGGTDHLRDVGGVLSAWRGRAVAVVVSDFYDPGRGVEALAGLKARGMDVAALHVLDAQDIALPLGERVRAVDQETGETLDLDVTEALLEDLHDAWRERTYQIERWCASREVLYHRVDVARPFWDVLQPMLGRGLITGGGR